MGPMRPIGPTADLRRAAGEAGPWAAIVIAAVGLALALRSLGLGLWLSSPVPTFDGWAIVDHLATWHEGGYGLADLFEQHNEHRIVTTRLTFLLDELLFHLAAWPVVLVDYALFGALAAVLAGAATRGRPGGVRVAAAALALAAMWSAAGWINLVWSFQVQWAYVHLMAVLAVAGFAAATARRGALCGALLAGACLADALAVFSMSSGLVTVLPVAAVAIWRRAPLRLFAIFAAVHAGLAALYLHGYEPPPQRLVASPAAVLRYLAPLFGTPFPVSKAAAIDAGSLGLALAVAALGWPTWRAVVRRRPLDVPAAVLLGAAAFALAEGCATAFGRAGLANPTQLALRYATPAELLWTSLGLLAWRWLAEAGRRRAAQGVAALAVCAVAASNLAGGTLDAWRTWSAQADAEGFNMLAGVRTDERGLGIVDLPDGMQRDVDLLRRRQLGPFAAEETRFRAPLNSLSGSSPGDLPACAGRLDDVSVRGGSVARVQGWTVSPGVPVSAAWALVYARDGRLLAFARTWQRRVDEARVSGRGVVLGFDVWLRLPVPSERRPVEMSEVVAIFPGHTAPPCRMGLPAPRIVPADPPPG